MTERRRHTGEFLRRSQDLFERALSLPESERDGWLRMEAGGDPLLEKDVRSLLEYSTDGVETVASLVHQGAAELAAEVENSWIGRRAGAWRVTGVLGRGGMGAVYEVVRDDGAYQLRAAMKIVRSEHDSADARRRFLEERQILARLDHPNIGRLLDGGTTEDGAPFLIMEAVDGQNILDHARGKQLPLSGRLRLIVTAARAVQSAHQRLVVHRDLKPANILVTGEGVLKLLDFGIAKLVNPAGEEALTRADQRLFTPEYASPEQVRGEPVGTATDVYSLGAVLYELLAGRRAIETAGNTTLETLRAVCEQEPRPPSHVAPEEWRSQLRGDLDTIVLTALQKETARRYQSVEQLADDLERYMTGRPIHARPDSARYRAGKFLRRHVWAASAAAVAVAGLTVGIIVSTVQARRAEKRFQQVRTLANRFLFDFHEAVKDLPGSLPARQLVAATALEYLDSLAVDAGDERGLLLELGTAYEKVGDVLGDRYGPNLGRTADALASHRKGLALKLKASGPEPTNLAEAASLIRSYYKVSDMHAATGDSLEAANVLKRGLDLAARRGSPEDRIAGLSRQGDLALRRGETTAIVSFSEALKLAGELYAKDHSPTTRRRLSSVLARVGHAYKVLSQDQPALQAFQRVIELNREALRENPDDPAALREMRSAHNERGDVLRSPFTPNGLRSELSLTEYQKSMELAEAIHRSEPRSFAARFDAFFARLQIADTWRELEPKRGVRELQQCVEMLSDLRRDNPAFRDADRLQALLYQAIGDAQIRAGDREGAERSLQHAFQATRALIDLDPGRRQMRRELALASYDLGRVRLDRGNANGAREAVFQCLPFAQSLDRTQARPLDLREAARCLELAGRVESATNRPAEAARHYRQALETWDEFSRRGLRSAFLAASREAVQQRLAALPSSARKPE